MDIKENHYRPITAYIVIRGNAVPASLHDRRDMGQAVDSPCNCRPLEGVSQQENGSIGGDIFWPNSAKTNVVVGIKSLEFESSMDEMVH